MASSLSYAELWKIRWVGQTPSKFYFIKSYWTCRKLVDVTERGALNFCEFAMGMYLIQALESCLIASVPSTVPPELHDLFSSRALFDSHPTSKRPLHSHRSSSSLQSSPMHSQMLLIPPTSGHIPPAHDSWDVSPIERSEANKHFQKLDSDRNGYIEGKQATNFMWNYNLSSEDLAHIWYV
jgi:epidermal growth factor receptor substrate 15